MTGRWRRLALRAATILAVGPLLASAPAAAQQRQRGICSVEILGVPIDLHQQDCGRTNQIVCDSGAACDPGFRALSFVAAGEPDVVLDCSILPDETITGACTPCGSEREPGCAAPNRCDAGLEFITPAGLDGPISACSELLPPDPPSIEFSIPPFQPYFPGANISIDLPPIETFIETYGTCSDGLAVNLAGASREVWPAPEPQPEPAPPSRSTAIVLHGRGSNCTNLNGLLQGEATGGGGLFERHSRTYCIEYDQPPRDGSRTVVAYEPVEQGSGAGPLVCAAAGSCSFDVSRPLVSVQAPAYSIAGLAAGIAQAIRALPIEGEITLVAHSQGGFLARALLHRHYDDLRWTGSEVSRVVTLGHPYFGMVVDPSLAAPWLCTNDASLDCHVLRWLRGWQGWLGTTAGGIDRDDFPQLEWTAVGGDGGATVPGALGAGPDVSDQCLEIFGGVDAATIAGDGGVSTQSSLGVDETGFFFTPIGSSLALSPRLVNCDHGSSCLLREALEVDPALIPSGEPAGPHVPGALLFDGIDDVVGGLSAPQVEALTITGALTLEAWIAPRASGSSGLILNKEGEYELGLLDGELSWAIANASPGWEWQGSGFFPPAGEWTHVAIVYDPAGPSGTVEVRVDGVRSSVHPASGPIGDAEPLDDFQIGYRARAIGDHFDGRIDDVRVWKRALDDATLRAHVAGAAAGDFDDGVDAADPDLLGWWAFDEGAGAVLVDRSANGHHLSLVALGANAAPARRREDRRRAGGTLYFDGVDDFARIADPGALAALEMTSALTIEAWLHPRGLGGAGGGVILNKEGEYALTRLPDGTIAFSLANSSPGWVTVATAARAPVHAWTHVALAYQHGTPGSVAIYENGALVDTLVAGGLIGDFTPAMDELRIGGRQATANNQWFHGALDELRLWNVARTPAEIAADYDRILADPSAPGLRGNWRFDQWTGSLVADASGAGHHAKRGAPTAASAPVPSWGPALPGHPAGLVEVPEAGVGGALAAGVVGLSWAVRRRAAQRSPIGRNRFEGRTGR